MWGGPLVGLHLTLKGQSQGCSDLEALYVIKE